MASAPRTRTVPAGHSRRDAGLELSNTVLRPGQGIAKRVSSGARSELMIRHALQYSALLASFLISATADASPLLILDSSGHWLGASDVTVDGNDYDLTFAQGSCAAVFGACGDDRFAFTTSLSALSAQHAIDTMAHDGSFENNPQLISLGVSGIITPYAVAPSVLTWT